MRQKTLEMESLYKWGVQTLTKSAVGDARIDAWYLLEFVSGVSRASYLAHPNRELTQEQAELYQQYIKERGKRIPLQHITHEQWFMGLPFYVNEHVLVPRQDTECLVEETLKYLEDGMDLLDMCTGSGCILLSLLKLKNDVRGVGADLSEEALKVAVKNNEILKTEADFIKSNLFEKLGEKKFDVIVSNPPYIPTKEIEKLEEEVKLHDPMMALDGMEDGLHFYRVIIKDSVKHLKSHGMLLFEIGYDQGEAVKDLMLLQGFSEVCVKKDLAGLDRVVLGRYN